MFSTNNEIFVSLRCPRNWQIFSFLLRVKKVELEIFGNGYVEYFIELSGCLSIITDHMTKGENMRLYGLLQPEDDMRGNKLQDYVAAAYQGYGQISMRRM